MLLRACGSVVALLLVAIAVGALSDFKARWFQTTFWVLAPIAAFAAARFESKRLGWFRSCATVAAVLSLSGIAARPVLATWFDQRVRPTSPFDAIAREIAARHPGPRTVIASDFGWAGSWELHFPADATLTNDYPQPLPNPAGSVLILWDASRRPELPEKTRQHVLRLTGVDLAGVAPEFHTAQWPSDPDLELRIGVLALPN
jgi:hypothetical protein